VAWADLVQSDNSNVNSDTSVSVTLSTIVEGNLIIVWHFTGDANSLGPSGYSEAVALTDSPNTDQGALYYKVATASESTTVTCTSSGSNEHMIYVGEFEGPWNATPLDQVASNGPASGSDDVSSGTTAATAQADELAVALFTAREDAALASSFTNSFVELFDGVKTSWKTIAGASKVLSATGTVETTISWSDLAGQSGMGGVATFKKQASAGAILPVFMNHYRQQGAV
jgi:hypothetical protein